MALKAKRCFRPLFTHISMVWKRKNAGAPIEGVRSGGKTKAGACFWWFSPQARAMMPFYRRSGSRAG
jgi:hypothetical protein